MTRITSAQGQILVLVLLVVLVGLTIGLSIASRTLTNIRNAGDLDQSNRAFSAAEAGIEKALARIKAGQDCSSGACNPNITGTVTEVKLENAGGNTGAFGIPALEKDNVIQLNLATYTGDTFDVYWGNADDSGNSAAAIVVSVVYANGANYGLGKTAIDPSSRNNNFSSPTASGGSVSYPGTSNGLTLQDDSFHDDYGFMSRINLKNSPGNLVPAGSNPVMARVRLLYNGPEQIAFSPQDTFSLPPQGQQITSTSSAGGKTRTVKVFKSNATLPAIFDYALFNGSTSPLTK